jgi:hypothetical protein
MTEIARGEVPTDGVPMGEVPRLTTLSHGSG